MLELKNLKLSYGNTQVLNGVDLSVNRGDVVSIIGPSGTGKTTLLKCINYLAKPASGTIAFDQVRMDYRKPDNTAVQAIRLRTAMVFQQFNVFKNMLRHPWSASLLPRRALGPNILIRLELLSKTLSGAGVTDADLNVAIWSLWNYVIGATITRANFDLSDDDRAAAQQRLTGLSEHYPTIERSRLLLDNDWDGAFRKGLDFLLDGLAPRR